MDLIAATPTSPSKYAPIQRHSYLHLGVLQIFPPQQNRLQSQCPEIQQMPQLLALDWGITYWLHREHLRASVALSRRLGLHEGVLPARRDWRTVNSFVQQQNVCARDGRRKEMAVPTPSKTRLLSTGQDCRSSSYISGGHLDPPQHPSENRNLIVCGL